MGPKQKPFPDSKAENYHYIETADIAHFYSEDGVVFLHTFNVAKYLGSLPKLSFLPACPHEVLVSRVRVSNFLNWMDDIVG